MKIFIYAVDDIETGLFKGFIKAKNLKEAKHKAEYKKVKLYIGNIIKRPMPIIENKKNDN